MGYRLPDRRAQIFDIATKSDILVDNGTITRISIPCFYHRGKRPPVRHSRMMHDHVGWPSPDSPDRSCQLPVPTRPCPPLPEEIDLPGEGYESIEIAFHDAPEGLSATGVIDRNIVRITLTAMCEAASSIDIDVPYSVYAIGTAPASYGGVSLRDVVMKGTLHIAAGPLES